MPMQPGSRGASATRRSERVSCSRIVRIGRLSLERPQSARWPSVLQRCGRSRLYIAPLLPGQPRHARRLSLVEDAFRTLPERYLGAHPGFDATYHVRLGDVGHTWEVRCTEHTARVRRGGTKREPDVVIGSDAATWLRLRRGELSGIEAFSQRL